MSEFGDGEAPRRDGEVLGRDGEASGSVRSVSSAAKHDNPSGDTPESFDVDTFIHPAKPEQHLGKFIFNMPLSDEEIITELVKLSEEQLGPLQRMNFPKGTRFLVEGERFDIITLVLSGTIALERASEAGDIVMHHASTGRIIGLLGLMDWRKSFFTATATTAVTGIQLTFDQVNWVTQKDRRIAEYLAVMMIRSFERRLRRSENIQIEKVELMGELARERENLANALHELEGARSELMAQARFALLGELSAGVAHELNNPMAAIQRTCDFLQNDVSCLLQTAPDSDWARTAQTALNQARTAKVLSTKEVRARKRELQDITGDAVLAQRLVVAGILDTDLARDLASGDQSRYEVVEQAAAIGTNLRNLATASRRIVELVASLRSYARPDGDPVADVDIHEGIEDTLRLLSHKLQGVQVVREYEELPAVACHPGQLAQVWTNLLSNAAEAMHDAAPAGTRNIGTITITTSMPEAGIVQVEVSDTGPGISPEVMERIFTPRFTTKGGQVRFGMGIGLSVCRAIITQHHGTITLQSRTEQPAQSAQLEQCAHSGAVQSSASQSGASRCAHTGAAATVRIPICPPQPAQPPPSTPSPPAPPEA